MRKLIALMAAATLSGCALNPVKLIGGDDKKAEEEAKPRKETPEFWRKDGKAIAKRAQKAPTDRTKARNLILFVGDGMGISTVTAARILATQTAGSENGGEEGELSFETFPATAFAKTYNFDLQTPQAAGAMTALLTGLKTRGSSVALDQIPVQGQCQEAMEHQEPTILEQAKASGMAAGLVTTARITSAVAAAAYAHVSNPNWEVDANLPPLAAQQGCEDIARQLVTFNQKGPLDVVFGGGRIAFLPPGAPDPAYPDRKGVRAGTEDLIAAWRGRDESREYVFTGAAMKGIRWKTISGPVMGLFSPDHMSFEAERLGAGKDEPSLSEMTLAAIKGLERNRDGYVLVVVAAGIGRGHDQGRADLAVADAVELANAVAAAREATKDKDTLIVVTASRGSTLAIGGAPARGSPILGAATGADKRPRPDAGGQPYPTLAYGSGPAGGGRREPPTSNAAAHGYQSPAAIALPVAAGGGEDVPVYALGPGSQWFRGVLDQHALYWLMRAAVPTLERGRPVRRIAGQPIPELPKLPKLPLIGGKKDEKKED